VRGEETPSSGVDIILNAGKSRGGKEYFLRYYFTLSVALGSASRELNLCRNN
jgi:hypothetical protein